MMYVLTVTSLLARDRWTQEPLVRTAFDDDDNNLSLTLWYNLNGEKRPWDVQVCYSEPQCPTSPATDFRTGLTFYMCITAKR